MQVHYAQDGKTLRIRFVGEMSEQSVLAHADEFRRRTRAVKRVQIQFSELTRATILGRSAFTELQAVLAEQGKRTAYIADSPRFRGTAIWIVKMCNDEGASVFSRPEQAADWLSDTAERTAGRTAKVLRWKGGDQ
ncbi:MAG: hypothetical protein AB8I08_17365 [Sandaracinaceae bacterium]